MGAKEAFVRLAVRGGARCVVVLVIATVAPLVAAIEVDEVVAQMERNQTHATSYIEGRFVVEDRFGRRESTFLNWNRGTEESLLEFTSPAEQGQRVLRTSDEIYLYYPDAAELIRLQGAALRESLLGSDVSYEDMTGNRGILDDYSAELEGTEEVTGRNSYVVYLTARTRDIAYPLQRLWIDSEDFVMLQSEQYALSGKLIKRTTTLSTTQQRGKIFPTEILIEDQLKRNSSTTVVLESITIDGDIPDSVFSLELLSF